MNKLMVIIFLSSISLSCSTNHYVENHYVDKNANGKNNGTSWSNAWKSFSDIEWNQIQPGDTLFISGGSDSTVYNEQINVGASGTAANLITIRAGLDAGHNGRVIFDGAGVINHGILIIDDDYLKIEKFEFKRHINQGNIHLKGRTTSESAKINVIYVDSCTFTQMMGQGAVMVGGWGGWEYEGAEACDSIFIRYNTVTSGYSSTAYVDLIYAQYSSNIFIEGNTLLQTNIASVHHNDCVQFVQVNNAIIKNNYMYMETDDITYENQMMMFEKLQGDYYIYNNVFYHPNGVSGHNGIYDKDYMYEHDIFFVNNTVIGGANLSLVLLTSPNLTVKNNIFYNSTTPVGGSIQYSFTPNDWTLTDGNLYGTYQVGAIKAAGTQYTMTQLNALGAETSGTPSARYLVDPLFQTLTGTPYGNDFSIGAGSPCINAGVDLGAPYNVDINGTAKPSGQYTIGAYQYVP